MSQEKVEVRRSYTSKTAPSTSGRTTVINRTSTGSMPLVNRGSVSMRMSMGHGVPNYQTGQVSAISQQNVNAVMENRAKEKTALSDLNNRFACYIEKVRFLECQNTQLTAEIEKLRKAKSFDPSTIKAIYEDEINECRCIIKDMSDEKAKCDSRMVDLEDELEMIKRDLTHDEDVICQKQQKIDALNKENADLDGEVSLLRRRCDSQEEEINRLKKEKANLANDLARTRADLEKETDERLRKEFESQAQCECLDLDNKTLKAMVDEYNKLANRDTTTDLSNEWKNQIRNVTKELQETYDAQLAEMSDSMRRNYEMQLDQQLAGLKRDNSEALMAKEETKTLKGKMAGLQPRIGELEAEKAALLARLATLQEDYDDECRNHEDDNVKLQSQVQRLSDEMEAIIRELAALKDSKLSLELEIGCYRKLLECEENSMRDIVQTQSGARSAGAQQLSEIIAGGGGGGSSEQKSSMSQSTMRVKLTKSSTSDFKFDSYTMDQGRVTFLFDGSKKQSLKGWKLKKTAGEGTDKDKVFEFPNDASASPYQKISIIPKDFKQYRQQDDFLAENISNWGNLGTFYLIDDSGKQKCEMRIAITM